MTNITNPYCKPLLDFNQANAEKINQICTPLAQHFDITAFFYLRVFDDGHYIMLSNHDAFLEVAVVGDNIFRTEYFSQQVELYCKYEPLKDIWPEDVQDLTIEIMRERGLRNGFNIIREVDGSLEAVGFSNAKEQSQVKQFYAMHMKTLEDFVDNFRILAGDMCDPSGPANLGFSPYVHGNHSKIERLFKTTTPWERKIIDFNNSIQFLVKQEMVETGKRYSLTLREIECLSYLTTGKSAKEIARLINISPRTVETHISNIRLKTRCQTKTEMTVWFEETFKPFLGKSSSNPILA